jgi:hypothetical protein
MRFLMTTAAAATIGWASFASSPVAAQGVEVQVPGVGVRIGEPDRRDRERFREREVVEPRGEPTAACQTRTERVERPDGSAYERQVRNCD